MTYTSASGCFSRQRFTIARPSSVGHPQVGEHDVELAVLELGRPGLAAGGDGAGVAVALQALGDGLGEVLVVVDHQHPQGFAHTFIMQIVFLAGIG